MADGSIESAPIASIQSLKSRFEQIATAASPSAHLKPVSPPPASSHSLAALAPNPAATPRARPRAALAPEDRFSHHLPVVNVLQNQPTSDPKATTLKRAPPPPPPPRTKKSSPVVSPLLRPVPAPRALRSPRASPEPELLSVRPEHSSHGTEESIEDGSLSSVASLRNRFSLPAQTKSDSARPTAPKPPPRFPVTSSQSDSSAVQHEPPAIPPRHAKPGALGLSQSPSVGDFAEISLPGMDMSARAGSVAAMRDRFATIDVSKPHSRDDHPSSQSELGILVTSPPLLPARPASPRPLNSALFAREDSLELPGSSASSQYSPFSDADSEVSELSEVCSPQAMKPRITSAPYGSPYANGIHHERKLSGSSSDSFSSPSKPKLPPRSTAHVPPRPPRRSNGLSTPDALQEASFPSSTTTTPTRPRAPPLPSRRATQEDSGPEHSFAPPLPARSIPQQSASVDTPPPVGERKPLGSAGLPPPPTRTIGLGDKLPPKRHARSPSSEDESGSEEDPRLRSAESLPDSSRSSRRPPGIPSPGFVEQKIQVPSHSGHVAVAGTGIAVASGHHIKFYSILSDEAPSWTLDTRDGMRGSPVSCLEFKPVRDETDRGRYLWVGTKDGHLLEVDIQMGVFTSSKMSIHASHVTHMFRHGPRMVTVDDAGKTFIFDPNANASSGLGASHEDGVHLVYTAPRVYRLGEKAEFVKLLGGLLWTATRTDVSGIGTASIPVIRIYDIYAPGSIGRAVMPNQHAGAVTSGTILPSDVDHVYLGHEGGFVSIWNVVTDDGVPACVEVVKVSASDVLCLEGVHDRLWAGGRKGTIAVYDVSAKPWVVTNCWDAHGGLPVSRVFVDPYAIMERHKLVVVSVGRDEQIKFWDGLLGVDQIEQELLKREPAFSTFRDLTVLIVTWNVDAAKPDALTGDPENARFLHDVLTSVDSPDIIAFGLQEVIDLESRSMAAKTVLLGGKKKGDEGKLDERVTSSYKRWHDRLIQAVKLAMPADAPYAVIHTESLVGLFTCVFVKHAEKASLKDVAIATIKRGMGGRYGNKGGIVARFVIDDSSLCFINCHLAAGQHHVRQRNADVAAFLEEANVFPAEAVRDVEYVGGGDGSMVLDHEIVFLNGDMNYRIDQRRDAVIAAVQAHELDTLLAHDQLHKEMTHNRAFRLRGFHEGPLTFAPTYKYDRQSDAYDTSEKRRVPAWCDRVLWRAQEADRVVLLGYRRWEVTVSDHRPVSAAFRIRVKKVVGEARARARRGLEGWWRGVEEVWLAQAMAFYAAQAVV